MNNIFNKIFKINKKLSKIDKLFLQIQRDTNINKIFKSISEYSDESEIRYVGGCVRKIINNEVVDDIDLATNLNPTQVLECLKKNNINFYESGIDHGTITAKIGEKSFEITSLRKDIFTDGRHAKVEFSENWLEDASRRDFTINSIYANLDGNLFDPFNGKKDLEDGNLKFVGNAEKRIKEDYLRILRYIRFFLNYSKIDHDPEIKKIIKQNIDGVSNISNDRLLDELKKLVLSKGFLKINNDSFSLEIILLIFPQLKNIQIFKNLNSYATQNISSIDFIFLLSIMIIDNSDNAEYFLYKYNFSNEDKKRIKFLSEIFSKPLKKNFFSEKKLWEILYFKNKKHLEDMINFEIFRSKKINNKLVKQKDFFSSQKQPIFPIKAKELMETYNLKEGKELGQIIKNIENVWIENSFKISDKEIKQLVND